jgi:hypothetical protein
MFDEEEDDPAASIAYEFQWYQILKHNSILESAEGEVVLIGTPEVAT